jgi:hypothetical protein
MSVCCGTGVKRMGMFGMSVRKMEALTVKLEPVALIDKGREYLTCFVYSVYEINSKILFLSRCYIFGGLS